MTNIEKLEAAMDLVAGTNFGDEYLNEQETIQTAIQDLLEKLYNVEKGAN